MNAARLSGRPRWQPLVEEVEARRLLSGGGSTTATATRARTEAEARLILRQAGGVAIVRPNTPVAPLESAANTASFIDPSAQVLGGDRTRIGQRDYVAPFATLDARGGFITVGSATSIGDNATLQARTAGRTAGAAAVTGIVVGDNVALAPGVRINGPAAVGARGGLGVTIGANAVIQGAIIQPGAAVGPLARVGPGVTVPSGIRVLPGANVTTQAQASDPALGRVVPITAADRTNAADLATRTQALAAAYTNLYQGISATGGATATSGPIPAPLAAAGTATFFGALNNVLGASPEPGTTRSAFEPAAVVPTFTQPNGTSTSLPQNLAPFVPARIIGEVQFGQPYATLAPTLGQHDSIRADEGQPFTFAGSLGQLGDRVTIHSPLGGLRTTTTTTVITTSTPVSSPGASSTTTTTVTNTTTPLTPAPTATAAQAASTPASGTTGSTNTTNGTTTGTIGTTNGTTGTTGTTSPTTPGANGSTLAPGAQGGTTSTSTSTTTTSSGAVATTSPNGVTTLNSVSTITTTATTTSLLGGISFGTGVRVGSDAVILGGPGRTSAIGDNVAIGAGAVVDTATLGSGVLVGDRAFVQNSTVPAGTVIPAGTILVNNQTVGRVSP